MKTNKPEVLNNYFKCQYFELNTDANAYKQFENYYNNKTKEYKYGLGIIELETNQILVLGLAKDTEDNHLFENLVLYMPNFSLQNTIIFFALIRSKQPTSFNPFIVPTNYPSEFVIELLKETNGYIIFSYQLMQLLSCCLPKEENNTTQINEYKRQYNCRSAKFLDKLETLYLPDGYCLANLLSKYTVIENNDNTFGFVSSPMYILAYQFIQLSKKYLTT